MRKQHIKGTLLFETFVALMIMSVGITSVLRIFGEALFVEKRSARTITAQEGIDKLLFDWFAHSGSVNLPDSGSLTLPLKTLEKDETYWARVASQKLDFSSLHLPLPDEANQDTEAPEPEIPVSDEHRYYAVNCAVETEGGQPVFEIDALVFSTREGAS